MRIGEFDVRPLSGGQMWLDGGTMFGVVPKPLWERKCPADEKNRVPLDTNCLLVQKGQAFVLVDSGYGPKARPRERETCGLQEGTPLVENLAQLGVAPAQIGAVVLTHLHNDHAGGCTYRDGSGSLRPTFPKARHFVQRREWDDATGTAPELAGAYFTDDFLCLEQSQVLERVDGEAEILPGVRVRRTGGHSRGHQIVEILSGEERGVYLGDLCPLTAHLKPNWHLSFDQCARKVRHLKWQLLPALCQSHVVVFFAHDPTTWAARLGRDKKDFAVQHSFARL